MRPRAGGWLLVALAASALPALLVGLPWSSASERGEPRASRSQPGTYWYYRAPAAATP